LPGDRPMSPLPRQRVESSRSCPTSIPSLAPARLQPHKSGEGAGCGCTTGLDTSETRTRAALPPGDVACATLDPKEVSMKPEALELRGLSLEDPGGDKVGEIVDFYFDAGTDEPEWLAVEAGLLDKKVVLAPMDGLSRD